MDSRCIHIIVVACIIHKRPTISCIITRTGMNSTAQVETRQGFSIYASNSTYSGMRLTIVSYRIRSNINSCIRLTDGIANCTAVRLIVFVPFERPCISITTSSCMDGTAEIHQARQICTAYTSSCCRCSMSYSIIGNIIRCHINSRCSFVNFKRISIRNLSKEITIFYYSCFHRIGTCIGRRCNTCHIVSRSRAVITIGHYALRSCNISSCGPLWRP